jgi:tetratricopeptide (TPR) repeat protein
MKKEDDDTLLKKAREAWLRQDHLAAFHIYEDLLHRQANYYKVFEEYGRAVYAEYDDFAKATDLFERALALEPTSIISLLYLGELYSLGYGKGYSGALCIYQKVLELAPQNERALIAAYTGIGMLHHALADTITYQDTIAAFRKVVEIAPHCAIAHHNLGMAFYEGGDCSEALNEFLTEERLLKKMEQPTDHVRKIITRIESNKPFQSGGYISCSGTEDWPLEELV